MPDITKTLLLVGEAMEGAKKRHKRPQECFMDADSNIVPIVEDDQGEGYQDPLDFFEPSRNNHRSRKLGVRRDTKKKRNPAKVKKRAKMAKASRKRNR